MMTYSATTLPFTGLDDFTLDDPKVPMSRKMTEKIPETKPSNWRTISMNHIRYHHFFILIFTAAFLSAQAQIFHSLPDWESLPQNAYSTGLGVADINQDGYDDIIVLDGNDMARQRVKVYYNNGNGTFPTSPSWNSADIDYHGKLAVGDINADGYPDVAVCIFLGPGGFSEPGGVKIYFNQNGQLESTPSFRTADSLFTFSCALGDADGDGDLDLAVAGGQPYSLGIGPYQTPGRIYFNDNGVIQPLPGWTSQPSMAAMDVDFADMDGNGFLDLIFASHLVPNYIFLADSSGTIHTQPDWQSADYSYFANSLSVARIDSNPYPDVVISDNNQLGGQGRFKAYLFDNAPAGQSVPQWYSGSGGYGSAVLAEDLDGDSLVDLIAGRWWSPIFIYTGTAAGFATMPGWSSSTNSVVEEYVLRDLDQDGRLSRQDSITISGDSVHVLSLSDSRVEEILSVKLNNQLLAPGSDYTLVPGGNWISISQNLQTGDQVTVQYLVSQNRDLVVSNWDPGKGNYVFYNQNPPVAIAAAQEKPGTTQVQVYPNPFNQRCSFRVQLETRAIVGLKIFDVNGRLIKTVLRGKLPAGVHRISWKGDNQTGAPVSSGMYFYRYRIGNRFASGKLLVIR